MQDKKLVTTTQKQNKSQKKQVKAARSPFARKMQTGLSLTGFIVLHAFAAFGRKIAAGLRAQGRSKAAHMIFAALTLEGPRLMLISRYRAARMEKRTKVGISAAGGTAIAAIAVATIFVGTQIFAVSVNGKVIGYVSDEGQYASLVLHAKEKISEQVGTENTEILIQDSEVSLEPVAMPQQPQIAQSGDSGADASVEPEPINVAGSAGNPGLFGVFGGSSGDAADSALNEDALADLLADSLISDGAVSATLYTITINGKQMATLGTMKEASDVLQAIADAFTPENGEYSGRFTDVVVINGLTTGLDDIKLQKTEEVITYLLNGTAEEKTYTTVEKDTIENICASLGVTENELRAEYPEYDFNKIKQDETFKTSLSIPYIHYETDGVEISNDPIPFETIDEKTNELFLGQRKTKVAGELGERRVTREITRINGEIVSSKEINSEVLKESSPETVLVGTQMVQMGEGAYVGSSDGHGGGGNGPLGRPLNSWYLTRGLGGGHNGDDMIAPRGTPIFAANPGTVTFVGVYGGYGNLVIIDHGSGLQTYYAHCDTFNTTEGATVERGQQIATVGITGRATAYHLHFEVRVNGVPQEPLDWIG